MNTEIKKYKSKKTDREYECLVLTLSNGYEKRVFLDSAEMYMFKEELKSKDHTEYKFK